MSTAPPQSRFCRWLDWTPPRWLLLALLCLAMYGRGQYAAWQGVLPDPDNYGTVAKIIHLDGTVGIFPERFGIIRATATRPPLYPLALSLGYRLGLDAQGVAGLLHALLAGATLWATWRLAGLCRLPPCAGLTAALLVLVDPILLHQSTQLMTETMAAALATLLLVAVTYWARHSSPAGALAAGLLAGLAILCRGEFLAVVGVFAAAFWFVAQRERRAARLATFLVVASATLAPWAVRNYRLFGWPVVTTTHGGCTLLLANNPDYYAHLRSAPWGAVWDGRAIYRQSLEHLWTTARQKPDGSSQVDELENDRWAYRQALEHIRAEPGMFVWSCVVRVGRLWNVLPHQTSPDESASRRGMRYAVAIWYTFELGLAAAGAWFLGRKLWRAPWLWSTLLLLSITAVHAFYWTDMRMRAPLVPVVCLTAAYALAVLACPKRAPSDCEQAA